MKRGISNAGMMVSSWVLPCWNFPENLALLLVPFPRSEKINRLTVWCEFKSYCCRLVRLDGQIVFKKPSFQTAKYQTICPSKNLFVPFSHQTICPSSSVKTSINTFLQDYEKMFFLVFVYWKETEKGFTEIHLSTFILSYFPNSEGIYLGDPFKSTKFKSTSSAPPPG